MRRFLSFKKTACQINFVAVKLLSKDHHQSILLLPLHDLGRMIDVWAGKNDEEMLGLRLLFRLLFHLRMMQMRMNHQRKRTMMKSQDKSVSFFEQRDLQTEKSDTIQGKEYMQLIREQELKEREESKEMGEDQHKAETKREKRWNDKEKEEASQEDSRKRIQAVEMRARAEQKRRTKSERRQQTRRKETGWQGWRIQGGEYKQLKEALELNGREEQNQRKKRANNKHDEQGENQEDQDNDQQERKCSKWRWGRGWSLGLFLSSISPPSSRLCVPLVLPLPSDSHNVLARMKKTTE